MVKTYIRKQKTIKAIKFDGANGIQIKETLCPTFTGIYQINEVKREDGTFQLGDRTFKCWITNQNGTTTDVNLNDYVCKIDDEYDAIQQNEFNSNYEEVKDHSTKQTPSWDVNTTLTTKYDLYNCLYNNMFIDLFQSKNNLFY